MPNRPWRQPTDRDVRSWLAISIVILSIIGVVIVAVASVAIASDKDKAVQLAFTALLPLFGTWVGTVMAFYFAKENLAAATESTARLTGLWEKTLSAGDAMLPVTAITAKTLKAEEALGSLSLSVLRQLMIDSGKHRLPVLDAAGVVQCLVPLSAINDYVAKKSIAAAGANPPDFAAVTLQSLLDDADLAPILKAYDAVAPGDPLSAARAKMAAKTGCKDIFVTDNGKVDGKLQGWLTDSDLAKVQ